MNLLDIIKYGLRFFSRPRYAIMSEGRWLVLRKGNNEMWRINRFDIEEIGFCTLMPSTAGLDYYFLLNAGGVTYYLAIDPEWYGVDSVVNRLSQEKGVDLKQYSLANSIDCRSVVAWPSNRRGEAFNFLTVPVY